MPRIFLMQVALKDYAGHVYHETLGWREACAGLGVALEVFAHWDVLPEIAVELGCCPAFGITAADVGAYADPAGFPSEPDAHAQALLAFMVRSDVMARACHGVDGLAIGTGDILLVPWADAALMNGVAIWLARQPEGRRPRVVLNFHRPEPSWMVDPARSNLSGDFSFFRFATRRLLTLVPPTRLLLTAAAEVLTSAVGQAAGHAANTFPNLTYHPDPAGEHAGASPGHPSPVVSVMGLPRAEKGSQLVFDYIEAFAAQRPGCSVFVQVAGDAEAAGLAEGLRNKRLCCSITLQAGLLPTCAYHRQVQTSSLLLLPYTGAHYRLMTSGVFVDALAAGVPVVVPDGTWMSDQLRAGWGAGAIFGEDSVQAVSAALVHAHDSLPVLAQAAAQTRVAWRRRHSVDSYLECLIHAVAQNQRAF